MLTDDELRLLTAAVDGELSPDRETALTHLLSESVEAAVVYSQLCDQRDQLKNLHRVSAPAGMTAAILDRIHVTVPATRRAPVRPRSRWSMLAVAASLAVAVVGGSFWFVSRMPTGDVARVTPPAPRIKPVPTEPKQPAPTVTDVASAVEQVPPPRVVEPAPRDVARETPRPQPKTVPTTPPKDDLIGSALLNDMKPLESVQVRLPLLVTVAEFDRPDVQDRFKSELGQDVAFRFNLFTRDTHRAVELFQAAARSAGVTVTQDATAHEVFKRKIPVAWALLTDTLTIDDIAKLVKELAIKDRAAGSVYAEAHVVPMRTAEYREIRELTGTELSSHWKRAKGVAPALPSTGKSVSAGTADQIAANLKAKPADKNALLLTYLPEAARANPTTSKEIREFIARRDHRPGTIPLLIVIRPSAN